MVSMREDIAVIRTKVENIHDWVGSQDKKLDCMDKRVREVEIKAAVISALVVIIFKLIN